jgi:hypothetical protein
MPALDTASSASLGAPFWIMLVCHVEKAFMFVSGFSSAACSAERAASESLHTASLLKHYRIEQCSYSSSVGVIVDLKVDTLWATAPRQVQDGLQTCTRTSVKLLRLLVDIRNVKPMMNDPDTSMHTRAG